MASEKEIEAAAEAIYRDTFAYDPLPWVQLAERYKRTYRWDVTVALRAAEEVREVCTTTGNEDMEAGCCSGCRVKQERLAAEKVREEK